MVNLQLNPQFGGLSKLELEWVSPGDPLLGVKSGKCGDGLISVLGTVGNSFSFVQEIVKMTFNEGSFVLGKSLVEKECVFMLGS